MLKTTSKATNTTLNKTCISRSKIWDLQETEVKGNSHGNSTHTNTNHKTVQNHKTFTHTDTFTAFNKESRRRTNTKPTNNHNCFYDKFTQITNNDKQNAAKDAVLM